ncbi:DUF4199 domain-containing protein [Seonamhaeicola marinus]|uniref:DUF4199 domain-containing protein n=1 Tax=Seonamhaeicola marinus TaxID=1912246 RepID=A0A5D0J7U2_9FLAO|nr:DUF4199 domain-containing protein [Seonamhaeicola marinus]TYA92263.1 DUF4199 domain-containing protein [Seonamhaeicola marinus]
MEKSFKSVATNYGLYAALALTLLTVIAYAFNVELFLNTMFGISYYIIAIVFAIISIVKAKKLLGGFISFKQAFTSYFITILIAFAVVTLVSFIIFNFVDAEAAAVLQEKSIEKMVKVYERMNLAPDKIAEIVEGMESQNLFSLKNSLISLVVNYILPTTIVGLIVAAVMKKNNPDAE